MIDFESLLAKGIHSAFEWQYSECDHGTYTGGPSDGEPYAMCEIFAHHIVFGGVPGGGLFDLLMNQASEVPNEPLNLEYEDDEPQTR